MGAWEQQPAAAWASGEAVSAPASVMAGKLAEPPPQSRPQQPTPLQPIREGVKAELPVGPLPVHHCTHATASRVVKGEVSRRGQ